MRREKTYAPDARPRTVKTYSTAAKMGLPQLTLNTQDRGEVHAIVSIFGNVDLQGDRVISGAFSKSLQSWKQSGDPIPIIWSHDWADPRMHIGVVKEARETDIGLEVLYQLDIATNPDAAQIFKLLKERRVREHSFAYSIISEGAGEDGANELRELDIIEIGPTLRGANEATVLLGVKTAPAPDRLAETFDDDLIYMVQGMKESGASDREIADAVREFHAWKPGPAPRKSAPAAAKLSVQQAKARIAEALGEPVAPTPADERAQREAGHLARAVHQLEHSGANLPVEERPRLYYRDGVVVDEAELEAEARKPTMSDPLEGTTYRMEKFHIEPGLSEELEHISGAPLFSASPSESGNTIPPETRRLRKEDMLQVTTGTPGLDERIRVPASRAERDDGTVSIPLFAVSE